MITQDFYLPMYGAWHIKVFYATSPTKSWLVIKELQKVGCSGSDLSRAIDNLEDGNLNTGLTYSNYHAKETVMVVSSASSPAQFLNSWVHEMLHLCRHISSYFDIDPYGEESAYLLGMVAQKMYPVAKNFICEHCCGLSIPPKTLLMAGYSF